MANRTIVIKSEYPTDTDGPFRSAESEDTLVDGDGNTLGFPSGVLLKNGTGTAEYATITLALAASVSGDVVDVPPGTWAESFSISTGVTVRSAGGRRATHITGAAATGARITMESNTALNGFKITAPTDAAGAIHFIGTTTNSHVADVGFIGNGGSGIGIHMTGTAQLRLDNLGYPSGDLAAFILQTDGVIIARDITLVTTGTCTDGFKIEGGYFGFEASFCIVAGTMVDGIHVSGSGIVLGSGVQFDNCTNGIHIEGDDVEFDARDIGMGETNTVDMLIDDQNSKVRIVAGHFHRSKLSIPGDVTDLLMEHIDDVEGDQALVIDGELAVGDPQRGAESVFGEGDSYVRNMVIITTDFNAGAADDGGNLTNVSVAAASASASTFTFQGVDDGYSILIGSNNLDITADALKHWGIKVTQTTAAVEVTPKSFAFELWNGSAWAEFNVMATDSGDFSRYGNEIFVRADNFEHIRYGITNDTTWAKKTIDGDNLYWARIRITTTLTTAPVFEQFKLSSSRFEANADGTNTYHGKARFRITLGGVGNIFSEGAGTKDINIAVGAGGVPTGWTTKIKKSELESDGDFLTMQMSIPRGIDTSHPVNIDAIVIGTPGGADPPELIMSVKPQQVEGVLVADPAFGLAPVARTLANTETITNTAAQTKTHDTTAVDTTKVRRISFDGWDVSDYYEGDMLFIYLEMNDDGDDNVEVSVFQLEVSGVLWTHGNRL